MCPAPEGFDFEQDGLIVSDGDIGCYCRPERGQQHPDRVGRPGVRHPPLDR